MHLRAQVERRLWRLIGAPRNRLWTRCVQLGSTAPRADKGASAWGRRPSFAHKGALNCWRQRHSHGDWLPNFGAVAANSAGLPQFDAPLWEGLTPPTGRRTHYRRSREGCTFGLRANDTEPPTAIGAAKLLIALLFQFKKNILVRFASLWLPTLIALFFSSSDVPNLDCCNLH